jgi:hypothetical protein
MAREGLALPAWVIGVEVLALLALTAGGVRLYMPEFELVSAIDEPVAWALVGIGLAGLAVFWIFFVRLLRDRRARMR